jgi:HPt (histidine-containing phosphotransfer) domain-containing protein
MQSSENSDLQSIKLYDLELIHKMCRGDEEKIRKMVEVFIDQISQSLQEINEAYSEEDYIRIEKLAHKIKPTLTYFGTSTLENELLCLEELAIKKAELSELELKIISFKNLTEEVVDKMKNDFNIIN